MKPDDKVCYCFHVPLRKLVNYARRERISRASQLSDCLNAGTGCGWCIPILCKIHALVQDGWEMKEDGPIAGLPDSAVEYENARKKYLKSDEKHSFAAATDSAEAQNNAPGQHSQPSRRRKPAV